MGLTSLSENVGRTLAVFGIVTLMATFGTAIYKASLVDDVYLRSDTFSTPGDPGSSTDPAVRQDFQDVATVNGWERTLLFLGVGSILAAILLTFSIVVYRGVKLVQIGFPQFWAGYLRAHTGKDARTPRASDDDVALPFGGGA